MQVAKSIKNEVLFGGMTESGKGQEDKP